jgi:biotin carboxyl carrier protein
VKFSYHIGGQTHEIELQKTGNGYRATVGGQSHEVEALEVGEGELVFSLDGRRIHAHHAAQDSRRWLAVGGRDYLFEKSAGGRRGAAGGDGGNLITAPMPGQVREVLAAEGDAVEKGQKLMLLEAMKMEIRILAPRAGVVASLKVKAGQQVDKDDVLAEVE